jgi:hypothetical protein
MIITEKIKIKASPKYLKLGYIPDSEGFLEILVKDLTKNSTYKILAKCDFCEIKKEIKYFEYTNNIKNIKKFACSKNCGKEKIKLINLEKYGVEHYSQTNDYKEKIKQTCLDKYGVENISKLEYIKEKKKITTYKNYGVDYISQSNIVKVKIKKNNLEKYGVEHHLQKDNFLNKQKQTNLEKYGFENPLQNEEIKNKIKLTNLEKYGVENPAKNEKIQEKTKNTNLEKYGVEFTLQSEDIKEKIKQTNLERYGFQYSIQNEEIKEKIKSSNLKNYGVNHFKKSEESKINTIIGNNTNYIKYLDNNLSLFKCDLNKDHEFEINSDNFHGRLKSNLPLCTICYPIGDNKSIKEKILLEYIQSIYFGEIISGYRDGIEIDIYLPELKIGIEFNGLYWHSSKFKESNYHINKLNYFKEKDIDIKFIYEDNFDNNLDIIKSQISNWLGLSNRIYARKCLIKEVINVDDYRNFLNNNHIQGFVASKLVYGLYHQNHLVSLICFDKKEGRLNMKEGEWNLNRFCNLVNTNVVGGASKLLNHFIKIHSPSRIISYADKDWSSGHLYNILGFKLLSESKPDYKYIVDGVRKSKQNFTKTKLGKMGHDISLTESQIMTNLGINRIYDCGKMKFEKNME